VLIDRDRAAFPISPRARALFALFILSGPLACASRPEVAPQELTKLNGMQSYSAVGVGVTVGKPSMVMLGSGSNLVRLNTVDGRIIEVGRRAHIHVVTTDGGTFTFYQPIEVELERGQLILRSHSRVPARFPVANISRIEID
jgi:hypothetical protein